VINQIPVEKILKVTLREGGEFTDLFFEQTHSVVIICEEDRIEKVISGLDPSNSLWRSDDLRFYKPDVGGGPLQFSQEAQSRGKRGRGGKSN